MGAMQMRDIDIRKALRSEMTRAHEGDVETLILDELVLCQGVARVDLAVVNGRIHGFEIKSEHDTLTRLPRQRDVYNRALDQVTIVVGPKFVDRIADEVPAWWGIIMAVATSEGLAIAVQREAHENPDLDTFAQAQLLWRDEALNALDERDLADGMRSKPRRELWRRLADTIPADELGEVVRDRLRRRTGWRTPEAVAIQE
jgi:hypothetical protein